MTRSQRLDATDAGSAEERADALGAAALRETRAQVAFWRAEGGLGWLPTTFPLAVYGISLAGGAVHALVVAILAYLLPPLALYGGAFRATRNGFARRFEAHCRADGTVAAVGPVLRLIEALDHADNRWVGRRRRSEVQKRSGDWQMLLVALVQKSGAIDLDARETAALRRLLVRTTRAVNAPDTVSYVVALIVLATEVALPEARETVERLGDHASVASARLAEAVAAYRTRV